MKLELENCDYGDDSFVATVIGYDIPDSINIKNAIESLPEILKLLITLKNSKYLYGLWPEMYNIIKKVTND